MNDSYTASLSSDEHLVQVNEREISSRINDMFSRHMTKEEYEAAIVREYCVSNTVEAFFETCSQAKEAVTLLKNHIDAAVENIMSGETAEEWFAQVDQITFHETYKAVTFRVFAETEKSIRKMLDSILTLYKNTAKGLTQFDAIILKTAGPSITWKKEN